jgi:hypothetical protein
VYRRDPTPERAPMISAVRPDDVITFEATRDGVKSKESAFPFTAS